jgi:hypothetical protein
MELLSLVDFINSSWDCQGFLIIGFGESLSDTRSSFFTNMVWLITWAQSISPTFGYIIENTLSQLDQKEKVQEHYTLVKHYLGKPLLLDEAQCNTYAHRLRNWWTNLAPLLVVHLILKYTIRDPNLQVFHILDDQSSYQPITRQKKPPWFPVNTIGKPRGACPTFVSFFSQEHTPFREMDQAWCIVMFQPFGINQTQKKEKRLWGSKLALLVTPRWLNWSVMLYWGEAWTWIPLHGNMCTLSNVHNTSTDLISL